MPLSEHEQRMLDQMEQALYSEDPDLASRLVSDPLRARSRRKLIIGILVLLAGLALVVLGVSTQQIWLGGVGFLVMVAGGGYAISPGRRSLGSVQSDGSVQRHTSTGSQRGKQGGTKQGGSKQSGAPRPRGSFMERMEQRWDRRRDKDGF